MSDFDPAWINLYLSSDNWGPFSFFFDANTSQTSADGALPYGATIADADVKVYAGRLNTDSDLSNEVELTNSVIDADFAPAILSNSVTLRFTHPGVDYAGSYGTIVITLTLSNGAVQPFFFDTLVFN